MARGVSKSPGGGSGSGVSSADSGLHIGTESVKISRLLIYRLVAAWIAVCSALMYSTGHDALGNKCYGLQTREFGTSLFGFCVPGGDYEGLRNVRTPMKDYADIAKHARQLFKRHEKWEPDVTSKILDLEKGSGGATEGLPFKIKTAQSIVDKFFRRIDEVRKQANSDSAGDLEKISGEMQDIVRYTLVFESKDYVAGVTKRCRCWMRTRSTKWPRRKA